MDRVINDWDGPDLGRFAKTRMSNTSPYRKMIKAYALHVNPSSQMI